MMDVSVDHPNDRPNFCRLNFGSVTLWFSYRTCIAYQLPGQVQPTVRENDWGPTTGKHIKLIEGSKQRVPSHEFEAQLRDITERMSYDPGPTLAEIREEFMRELETIPELETSN